MRKNIFVVVLLSFIFALAILYQFNLAFTILAAIIFLTACLKSEQAIIKLFFFIYLFLAGVADNFYIPISGNQSINFLGIINILMILTFYLKLGSFLQLKKEYWNKSVIYPMFLFGVCLVLTIPFSKHLGESIRGLSRILSLISFYFLSYFLIVRNKDAKEEIFSFFILAFFILSIFGIAEYLTKFNIITWNTTTFNVYEGGYIVTTTFDRIKTTFVHSGIYAFAILTFLPLNIYYLIKHKNKVYVYSFVLLLMNVILTYARIVWIAVVIQVIFSLFLFKSKRLFSICLLLIPFGIVMLAKIMMRLTIDSSAEGRIGLFQQGLGIFKAHPLFGSGYDTFRELSSTKTNAHGDYMRMFAETGIFGGLSYLILLFSYLYFTVKNLKRSDFAKVAFLTLIGFMVFSLTDNGLAHSNIFWGLLGIYNGLIVRDNSRVIYNISETGYKHHLHKRSTHVFVEKS